MRDGAPGGAAEASSAPATTSSRRRRSCLTARAFLLAGVAALGLGAGAHAQSKKQQALQQSLPAPLPAPSTAPARRFGSNAPLPDDGLGSRDLLLQADVVAQDQPNSTVTATGHVEARYQGRTVRADKLSYNTVTGAAHATGHAVVVNPDGSTVYGEDVTLDDQFRAALALGFATRQAGNSTITAGAAVRRNDTITQLNNAVYTSCNICALDGSPKPPTWSISASRIVQDKARQVIYYRNAVIRVMGVPIFYAPVFWHPDPTAPRRSGFLAPKIEYSRRRGFSYEQPYLLAVNPSTDLIISPQINSRVNPFLNVRYTERFYSGMIDIRAGYTNSPLFNSDEKYGVSTSRSYILGRGLFDVTPDKNWVWGFGLERTSDPTLFARYGIHTVFEDRGPFPTDTDRLISQVYTVRADDTSYVSLAALDFESVRAYGLQPTLGANGQQVVINNVPQYGPFGIYESTRAFPVVGPLFEARYDAPNDILGGQLRLNASGVVLSRNNRVISVYDPTGGTTTGAPVEGPQLFNTSATSGISTASAQGLANLSQVARLSALEFKDSRRFSLGGDWRSSLTFDNGMRLEPFAFGRGDVYSLTDPIIYRGYAGQTAPSAGTVYQGQSGGLVATAGDTTVPRIEGTLGANFSWPFMKPIGSASIILEPLAQLAVSPVYRVNPNIPNEDSASFEYDETNLFSINRFAGFDLLEGGQRINVGGRASLNWGATQNASLLVGRTFRAQNDPQFTDTSGLAGTSSDWIVAATAQPFPGLQLFTRSRLDQDTYAIRREEAGIGYSSPRLSLSVRYDLNENGLQELGQGQTVGGQVIGQPVIGKTEDIYLGGYVFLTRHWGVSANVSRDLQNDIFPIEQIGLIYDNECIRVDVIYTHDTTYGSVLGTSDGITFRISLTTLGGTTGLAPNNNRGIR